MIAVHRRVLHVRLPWTRAVGSSWGNSYVPRHKATFFPVKAKTSASQLAAMYLTAVVISATAIYAATCIDEAPVTKRKRVILVPKHLDDTVGRYFAIEKTANELPHDDPRAQLVFRIAEPIIAAADVVAGEQPRPWTLTVVESDKCNAFCAPGRVIVVFTGLIDHLHDIATGDVATRLGAADHEAYNKLGPCTATADDLLAMVLAHECGHALARHAAENLTWLPFFLFVSLLQSSSPIIETMVRLGIRLPQSRAREREADAIGMTVLAQACKNLAAGGELQRRFAITQHSADTRWTSTHPGSIERAKICDMFAEALQESHSARCTAGVQQVCGRGPGGTASWLRWSDSVTRERC